MCCDIEVKGVNECTALEISCGEDKKEVVRRLLVFGARINVRSAYSTPLISAIEFKYPNIVNLLIDAGADVNFVSRYIDCPLHKAVARGSVSITRALIAAGANVNAWTSGDITALFHLGWRYWGKLQDRITIAQILLDNGADPYAHDREGNSPFRIFISYENLREQLVPQLLEAAPLSELLYDRDHKMDTLLIGVIKMGDEYLSCRLIEILSAAGVSDQIIDRQDICNEATPLMLACMHGLERTALSLLHAGAHIHQFDNKGLSVLDYLFHPTKNGNVKIDTFILEIIELMRSLHKESYTALEKMK